MEILLLINNEDLIKDILTKNILRRKIEKKYLLKINLTNKNVLNILSEKFDENCIYYISINDYLDFKNFNEMYLKILAWHFIIHINKNKNILDEINNFIIFSEKKFNFFQVTNKIID